MPYITQERRRQIQAGGTPTTAGELNYAITRLLNMYQTSYGPTYQAINDALGALEGAKLEFYRRIVVPYEERKLVENGDVY